METIEQIFEHLIVVKRSGQRVNFNGAKVVVAIKHAFDSIYEEYDERNVNKVYKAVLDTIAVEYESRKTINVEDIQDLIETTLQKQKFTDVYLSFNNYRLRRAASREVFSIKQQHKFVKAIEKIGLTANTNQSDKPIDLLYKFGKNIFQEFTKAYLLESKYVRGSEEGLIAIDDLNTYVLGTIASIHLDLRSIEAISLEEYVDKLLYLLTHVAEEQYGEQSIPELDDLFVPILLQEYRKTFFENLLALLNFSGFISLMDIEDLKHSIFKLNTIKENKEIFNKYACNDQLRCIFKTSYEKTITDLEKRFKYEWHKLILYLNGNKSKLGSSIKSISLSINNSYENLFLKNIHLELLEKNENLDYMITIFKIDKLDDLELERISDLILQGKNIRLLFINNYNVEVFSTGQTIYENVNHEIKTSFGRTINSSVSINLTRLALQNINKPKQYFYEALEDNLELCKNLLIQRFDMQGNKYRENYDYLFRYPVLFDSTKLDKGQKIRKIIRHGTLEISYVGLGECVCILQNKTNLDENDFVFGHEVLKFMNDKIDKFTCDNKLNFILAETQNENIRKNLLAIDKSVFGSLEILKKNRYDTLSYYLDKIEFNKSFDIAKRYQYLSSFLWTIYVSKNVTAKKIIEIINSAHQRKIKCIKIQVGKHDN